MKASEKQLKYIEMLAKQAGKEVNQSRLDSLTKQQASIIIDNLQNESPKSTQQRAQTINDALFGLAAKLVWQHNLTIQEPPLNRRLSEKVIKVYTRLTEAKQKLKKSIAEGQAGASAKAASALSEADATQQTRGGPRWKSTTNAASVNGAANKRH